MEGHANTELMDAKGFSSYKKRKLMHAPDGFENSRRNTGRAQAPAPKFSSAFEDPRRSKLTVKDSPLRVPRLPTRLLPISQEGSSTRSPLLVGKAPISLPRMSPQAGPAMQNATSRPMKPSSFQTSLNPGTKFTSKGFFPSSSNRRPHPERNSVSKASLRKFQPLLFVPPLVQDSVKPTRSIHALRPSLPPLRKNGPRLPDASMLKTISTTRVAVALDPRTESGTDELLALHLEQITPAYVPPAERELNRGLGQSPEKASKSKRAKFVKGGLAERAQLLFSKKNTSLALWYKDMQLQGERPKTYSRVAPDLRLRVTSVLHTTSIAILQRSHNVPRLCIVRCAKIIKGRVGGELTVLLDFGRQGSLSEKAHTLNEVKDGTEVHIWWPWNSSQVDAEEICRHGAPPRDGTTLFCTRFRMV